MKSFILSVLLLNAFLFVNNIDTISSLDPKTRDVPAEMTCTDMLSTIASYTFIGGECCITFNVDQAARSAKLVSVNGTLDSGGVVGGSIELCYTVGGPGSASTVILYLYDGSGTLLGCDTFASPCV